MVVNDTLLHNKTIGGTHWLGFPAFWPAAARHSPAEPKEKTLQFLFPKKLTKLISETVGSILPQKNKSDMLFHADRLKHQTWWSIGASNVICQFMQFTLMPMITIEHKNDKLLYIIVLDPNLFDAAMEPIMEGDVFEVEDENEIEFSERPSERGFLTIAPPLVHPPGSSFCLSQLMAMPVSVNTQAWPLGSLGLEKFHKHD